MTHGNEQVGAEEAQNGALAECWMERWMPLPTLTHREGVVLAVSGLRFVVMTLRYRLAVSVRSECYDGGECGSDGKGIHR